MIAKAGCNLSVDTGLNPRRRWRCLYFLALTILIALQTRAQETHVPDLGSRVPSYMLRANTHSQQCLTDINHHDPCASVEIDKKRFTIAWDARTKTITYIFTEDRHFRTDSELRVNGLCRVSDPAQLVRYMDWVTTRQWADTVRYLSGDALWYAALHEETSPGYAHIVGFVQSRFLKSDR
jgi:hypothetical protein